MFRTQGGDFSFPYKNPNSKVVENRQISKKLFVENTWEKRKYDFQWLLKKFNPPCWNVPVTKGILYYTDNRLDEKIMKRCQDSIKKANLPITSVSLEPIDFGDNIVVHKKRGLRTMTEQIITGLESMTTDIVFMCEHDVLYHPSHFTFTPKQKDVYYYNTNVWVLRAKDGHCVFYDHKSLSGMSAYRETLIKHYKERLRRIDELIKEANGTEYVTSTNGNRLPLKEAIHRLGFEPGTHSRPERVDLLPAEGYESEQPNIDIRHDKNETQSRWSIDKFRSKPTIWKEADEVPYWGHIQI
jgi:hypothetical protein